MTDGSHSNDSAMHTQEQTQGPIPRTRRDRKRDKYQPMKDLVVDYHPLLVQRPIILLYGVGLKTQELRDYAEKHGLWVEIEGQRDEFWTFEGIGKVFAQKYQNENMEILDSRSRKYKMVAVLTLSSWIKSEEDIPNEEMEDIKRKMEIVRTEFNTTEPPLWHHSEYRMPDRLCDKWRPPTPETYARLYQARPEFGR